MGIEIRLSGCFCPEYGIDYYGTAEYRRCRTLKHVGRTGGDIGAYLSV